MNAPDDIRMPDTAASSLRRWLGPARDTRALDIVLNLTAITLLLRPFDVWWVSPFVLLGAGLSLLFPPVRSRAITWWTLAVLVSLRIAAVWPLSDNHIYLLAYWCLAVGLALQAEDSAAVLASASRWLLGAAFAFAVLWKAFLSPDYLDGRFFRVTLLTDPRFADAVRVIGGLSKDDLDRNREALQALPQGAELLTPAPIVEPPRFRALALALTWGGVLLEALLAILHVGPWSRRLDPVRHVTLMLFCITTYAFAPVAGFGWLIATMGLAQCEPERRVTRGAYVAVFFLVLLYAEIPWAGVIADWMS
jgi:hypothetical protein